MKLEELEPRNFPKTLQLGADGSRFFTVLFLFFFPLGLNLDLWPHAFSRVLMTSKLWVFVIEAIHFAEIRPFLVCFFSGLRGIPFSLTTLPTCV